MAAKKLAQEIVEIRAEQYKNCFGTGVGAEVLKHFKMQWQDRPLLDKDPLIMAANCALHDAYLKIEYLVDVGRGIKAFKKVHVVTKKSNDRYDVNAIVVPEEK